MSTEQDLGNGQAVKEVDAIDFGAQDSAASAQAGDDKSSENKTVDYKSELEKAQRQLGQAGHVIEQLKQKNKEDKPDSSSTTQDIAETIRNTVREVYQEEKKAESESRKNTLLESVQNANERELIKFHLENTIKATGNVEQDFRTARTLANSSQLFQENEELKRAQQTETVNDSMGSAKRDNTQADDKTDYSRHFTPEQLARFKMNGIDPKDVLEKAKNMGGNHQFSQTTLEDYTPKS